MQIVYLSSDENKNEIHSHFKEEAEAKQKMGLMVGTVPDANAKKLLYRGFSMLSKKDYPADIRFLNNYETYINYFYLSRYYPCISDLTIETFFVDDLNDELLKLIKEKGWEKVFIKKEITALEHIHEGKSVWPDTTLHEMKDLFSKCEIKGAKYGVRKYIDPEILKDELRYWVLNGRIYRRDNIIPDIVKEAAERLNIMGSKYYTIDATPELIVEVNPGESSDRHAENSPEIFASWFKKEFA